VQPDLFETQRGAPVDQDVKLIDVRMDVSVRKQPDKMDRASVLGAAGDAVPDVGLKNPAGLKGGVDQTGALVKNPARAHRVVPDFAVAHIVIRGQSDGCAVGFELCVEL